MTVHELIQALQQLDPTLEVLMSGYEGGYNIVEGVSPPQEYVQNVNDAWYYGPHEQLGYQLELEFLTVEEAAQKGIFKGVLVY